MRVNLSDLAAKGAEPFGYLLALALDDGVSASWLEAFSEGLAADQARYGVTLLGGDTLKAAGGTTIAITAFGTTPTGSIVRRSGARPGEVLVLTGPVGDASLYLRERMAAAPLPLSDELRAHLREAYLLPQPPVGAFAAVRRYASAAMDVSDGLLGDLRKLARASGVGAIVDPAKLPLSTAGRAVVDLDPAAIETVMTGGDDYQILAAMPARSVEAYLQDLDPSANAAVIGATTDVARGVLLKDGEALRPIAEIASFQHF